MKKLVDLKLDMRETFGIAFLMLSISIRRSGMFKSSKIRYHGKTDFGYHVRNVCRNIDNDNYSINKKYKENRAKEQALIQEQIAKYGGVLLVRSGTDCDCVDYSYARKNTEIKNLSDLDKARFDQVESADGPCSLAIVSEEEFMMHGGDGSSFTHDHIMEAFENGRGTCVVV